MLNPDPLKGIDDIPWRRIVHFYGRATQIPGAIRDLATGRCAKASSHLSSCLTHQDSVIQATPFAVWFIIAMLNANAVRDPQVVRRLLHVIHAAARFQVQCLERSPGPKDWTTDWKVLLAEERLRPEFTNEHDEEILSEEWFPVAVEWNSWAMLTDKYIAEGLAETAT
jgi:hypothetical protein